MKIFKKIIIIIYVVIAAEIFLRVFHQMPMLPRYIVATDYGIRGNQPNAEYKHKTADYTIDFKINSKGVRSNHEIPYEKSNKKRILLLGDSFGMGYGVALEGTFLETAGRNLSEKGIENEVINLSVSGHGNAEELVALKSEGLKYKPDLVVLGFHDSDYEDNVRSNLFKFENDSLIPDSKTYLPAVKLREKLFSYPLYRWLAGNCNLYNWLRDYAGRISKKILAAARNDGQEENVKTEVTTTSINENSDQLVENTGIETNQEKYEDKLTVAILKEINQVCKDNGAEFVIIEIPRKIRQDLFLSPVDDYVRNNIKGLNFVSPLNVLYENDDKMLYWEREQGHFTPLGYKLVGNVLSDYILKNNLLHE